LTEPTHSDQIDPGKYVASFDDSGEITVWEKEPASSTPSDTPILRLQVEDNRPEEVVCRYTLLRPDLSDAAARCLIRLCVLRNLLRYDILDPKMLLRIEKQR
jgi:hypothetical protein